MTLFYVWLVGAIAVFAYFAWDNRQYRQRHGTYAFVVACLMLALVWFVVCPVVALMVYFDPYGIRGPRGGAK